MSKITRVVAKLFGSTGSAGDFGEPGSLPAGTKVNTQDPATIQSLSAFLTGLAAIVQSGTYKIALEDLNSLFLLAFYQISYLMQAGIAEWDTNTVYYTGSLCSVSGTIYKSLSDANSGHNPTSDATNWTITAGVPVGSVQDFAGPAANIPNGFLLCDGSTVSRATYANLFTAIGTAWNTGGEAGTVFRLPPGGITAIGYKAADSDFGTVGHAGGVKTNTHTHSFSGAGTPGGGGKPDGMQGGVGMNLGTGNIEPQTFSGTTGAPSDTNNLPPFGVFLKIIKY